VTADDRVSYCRTTGSARLSCTGLDTASLRWDRGQLSSRTDWTYADPF